MMHQQLNPAMRIVAVDNDEALVTFDTASAFDIERAPVALRIRRSFTSLKIEVARFVEVPELSFEGKREYRSTIKLLVTAPDGEKVYDLAHPVLQLDPMTKARRGVPATNFPSVLDVTMMVRQAVAVALDCALGAYVGREGELEALKRVPASGVQAQAVELPLRAPAAIPAVLRDVRNTLGAANDTGKNGAKFRRQIWAAATITPIVVVGAIWLSSAKSTQADPIHDAVAQAMVQQPTAAEAQVELTKQTLKQMGLDPGAAGDTGCLAAK